MGAMLRRSRTFLRAKPQAIGLISLVVAFGGLGVYLLHTSKASVDTSAPSALLSLAPAQFTMAKGQVVNMAVNVNTGSSPVGDVSAVIHYPTSLSLQAVRDACPGPAFTEPETNSVSPGTITIHCKQSNGAQGRITVAMLVFAANGSSGDAGVTIDSSSVVKQGSGQNMTVASGRLAGATITLDVSATAGLRATATKIAQAQYRQTACTPSGDTGDGSAICKSQTAKTSTPRAISSDAPDDAIALDPPLMHSIYHMPCATGSKTVQAVCPQPSSFGPATVAAVVVGGYAGGVTALEADFATYNQKYGLPNCTVANGCLSLVDQTGGTNLPPASVGDDPNIMLSLAAIHGMCQNCKIQMILGANPLIASAYATQNAVKNGYVAVSHTWESNSPTHYSQQDSTFASLKGTAMVWGDYGQIYSPTSGVDGWPGSVTGNVYVAATIPHFDVSTGIRTGEVVGIGTLGGCVSGSAAPAWQTSLSNWSGVGCGTNRAFGDISADTYRGMYLQVDGQVSAWNGASLGAGLVAGMFGLAGSVPSTMTGAEALYHNSNSSNTYDITGDSFCGDVYQYCSPGPGFDVPSGLGAPSDVSLFSSSGGGSGKTGDLNGDGKVNIQDLALLLINFGKTTATGDLNNDGKVTIQDLALLLINFGK